MSRCHPETSLLLSFDAGNLSSAQALAVRVHLSYCHQCRQQLRQLAPLGGALLEQLTPASLDEGSFDSLMAQLDSSPAPAAPAPAKVAAEASTNPLLAYLPAPLAQLHWQRQTRSIFKFDLAKIIRVPGFQVALQKISAGAQVPTHTHQGLEYTVVLSGGFSDEMGVYHPGDFIARDPSHKHTPRALQNEDCICLTVLGAPLKFTGWQRIFNPFLRWH